MTGVWIGVSAALTAATTAYTIDEGKKKTKKLLKVEEKEDKRQSRLKGMQDQAERSKLLLEQEKLKKKGSGVQSTLLTGGSKTLG